MAAYSLDLRKRIVDAVERGIATKREIAKMFGVHETFVHKLLRQKRERGDIAPLPHGGGHEAILKEEHLLILTELVAESPDATLEELREHIKKRTQVEASTPTIWRALKSLGFTRKKSRGATTKPTWSREPRSRRNK
jgi:transposase